MPRGQEIVLIVQIYLRFCEFLSQDVGKIFNAAEFIQIKKTSIYIYVNEY